MSLHALLPLQLLVVVGLSVHLDQVLPHHLVVVVATGPIRTLEVCHLATTAAMAMMKLGIDWGRSTVEGTIRSTAAANTAEIAAGGTEVAVTTAAANVGEVKAVEAILGKPYRCTMAFHLAMPTRCMMAPHQATQTDQL